MNINHLRKKLLYKSWHRGCKETDILLGHFAKANIDQMTEAELNALEVIVNAPDAEIYDAIASRAPIPSRFDHNLFKQIVSFNSLRVNSHD